MTRFMLKKIGNAVLVIFLVSVLVFLILRLIPGDPVRMMVGFQTPPEYVEQIRSELNLDKPLTGQYLLWVQNLLKGDFGKSYILKTDVTQLLAERFPITISLAIFEMILGTVFGIVIGVIAATKRGSIVDQTITFFTTTVAGIPVFWTAILLIYFFSLKLHLLPISGYVAPKASLAGFIRHGTLPVLCIILKYTAELGRTTRTNFLEIINQDYIRTAQAGGLKENRILYKHALKNAMIPIATFIGLQIRVILGGSVLVEQVFRIPGIGQLLISSLLNRDYLVIQACVLVIAVVSVIVNLLLEILYGVLDPRIRLSRSKA